MNPFARKSGYISFSCIPNLKRGWGDGTAANPTGAGPFQGKSGLKSDGSGEFGGKGKFLDPTRELYFEAACKEKKRSGWAASSPKASKVILTLIRSKSMRLVPKGYTVASAIETNHMQTPDVWLAPPCLAPRRGRRMAGKALVVHTSRWMFVIFGRGINGRLQLQVGLNAAKTKADYSVGFRFTQPNPTFYELKQP